MSGSHGGADERSGETTGRLQRTAGSGCWAPKARRGPDVECCVVPHLGSGDVRRDRMGAGWLARHEVSCAGGDSRGDGRFALPRVVPVRYATVNPEETF